VVTCLTSIREIHSGFKGSDAADYKAPSAEASRLQPKVAPQELLSAQTPVPKNFHKSAPQLIANETRDIVVSEKKASRYRRLFPDAQVIYSDRTEVSEKGFFLKVRIVRTDEKYPIVRIVERWKLNDPSMDGNRMSEEELNANSLFSGQSAMVGDHVLVQLPLGQDPSLLKDFIQQNGGQLREAHADSSMALVSFDGTDPTAMGRMLKAFSTSKSGAVFAGPDYLATVRD